jgi:hypothetical protein
MKKGDIVRLKPNHHICQFIEGDCRITEVRQYTKRSGRKTRYHITNKLDHMTWVYADELDLVSDLRDQVLNQLLSL